jgi:hypothetical protein
METVAALRPDLYVSLCDEVRGQAWWWARVASGGERNGGCSGGELVMVVVVVVVVVRGRDARNGCMVAGVRLCWSHRPALRIRQPLPYG